MRESTHFFITVVQNLQKGQHVEHNSCTDYLVFRTRSIVYSNTNIVRTRSVDIEMKKKKHYQ